MKEIHDILLAFDLAEKAHKKTALATVVHVEGSSYRQAGARMLIQEDGQLTGAISGGCLEGDALRKALHVILQQQPMLVTYDTTDEDDAKLGVGLGCNGIIQVLIEPIDPLDKNNPIAYLKAATLKRAPVVLVSMFSLQDKKMKNQGTCVCYSAESIFCSEHIPFKETVFQDARAALMDQQSVCKAYSGYGLPLYGFIQVLEPVIAMVVVGAGNDAIPLVKMADLLGWETTVVDGRANYATAARFPTAQHILVARANRVLDQIKPDAQTVFVLMTHNYNYDLAMLKVLLALPIPYIGMLGPRKKMVQMHTELLEQGDAAAYECMERVHCPAGLDIGAESPEEIALSILAEIRAVLKGRKGGALNQLPGSIHDRPIHSIKELRVPSGH